MKKHIYIVTILAVVSLLTACFSPWTGDSSITINLGRSMGRYYLNSKNDIEGFEYNITLRGPGGTITKQVKESGPVTLQVVPGIWTVDVRAYGDNTCNDEVLNFMDPPVSFQNRDRILRALAIDTNVEVKAGVNRTIEPDMKSAIEVYNFQELNFAISIANFFGGEEIIVFNIDEKDIIVKSPMDLSVSNPPNPGHLKMTIISDGDITLKRDFIPGVNVFDSPFFTINQNVTLTLGMQGMTGTITIDGYLEGDAASNSLITVEENGTLVMNEDINLINNNSSSSGGGVEVNKGIFTMNGGLISGNEGENAGGVSVEEGECTMNGGFISGNQSKYSSGGVYVWEGKFTMNGGEISGNESEYGGGGVHIFHYIFDPSKSASFEMSGNAVISGNSASGGGGGVFIEGGTFTMEGGTIITNEAGENYGGGVYLTYNGTFNMSGSAVIDNNTARHGGGVYIDSGKLNMEDNAVIKNNKAHNGNGGGVFLDESDARFNMLGGSIESNECVISGEEKENTLYGGGVFNGGGHFYMSGGRITQNTIPASGRGAGVCVLGDSDNTVLDETRITGNLRGGDNDPGEQFFILIEG